MTQIIILIRIKNQSKHFNQRTADLSLQLDNLDSWIFEFKTFCAETPRNNFKQVNILYFSQHFLQKFKLISYFSAKKKTFVFLFSSFHIFMNEHNVHRRNLSANPETSQLYRNGRSLSKITVQLSVLIGLGIIMVMNLFHVEEMSLEECRLIYTASCVGEYSLKCRHCRERGWS